MRQKIGKKVLIYSFILVLFGTFNNQKLSGLNYFELKDIIIESSENSFFSDILDKTSDLKKSNIFLISRDNIKEIIENNSLVENYFVIKNSKMLRIFKLVKDNDITIALVNFELEFNINYPENSFMRLEFRPVYS